MSEHVLACAKCDGDGYIDVWHEDLAGNEFPVSAPCPDCLASPGLAPAASEEAE